MNNENLILKIYSITLTLILGFIIKSSVRGSIVRTMTLVTCALLSVSVANSQSNLTSDPNNASFVYEDVELFLSVYNSLHKDSDTLSVLQKEYLDKGSVGLKEYINRHGLNAELMKEAIQNSPEEYDSLKWVLGKLKQLDSDYKEICTKYSEIMAKAVFAPTYFVVGANRGIAQASKEGQLVSVTVFANQKMFKKLIPTIIHELTHFQQKNTMGFEKYVDLYSQNRQDDLLGFAVREGVAEFMTMLVTGSITQARTLQYYKEQDENKLWVKFTSDVENKLTKEWLWETVGKDNHLIAYVMGYFIAQGYYDKASDKGQAIDELLKAEDDMNLFIKSGLLQRR